MRCSVLDLAGHNELCVIGGRLQVHPREAWPELLAHLRQASLPEVYGSGGAFDFEFLGLGWKVVLTLKAVIGAPVIELRSLARVRKAHGEG